MLHVSYGLFIDADHAQAALTAIGSHDVARVCAVELKQGHLGDVGLAETGAKEGVRTGAAMGAVLGAATGGVIVGPIGVAAGAAMGAVYGGIAGALGGSNGPDRVLEEMSRHLDEGKAILIVEAPSNSAQDAADDLMRASGGTVEHKPLF